MERYRHVSHDSRYSRCGQSDPDIETLQNGTGIRPEIRRDRAPIVDPLAGKAGSGARGRHSIWL